MVLGNKELVTVSNAGGLWSNNNASILNTSLNYFIPERGSAVNRNVDLEAEI